MRTLELNLARLTDVQLDAFKPAIVGTPLGIGVANAIAQVVDEERSRRVDCGDEGTYVIELPDATPAELAAIDESIRTALPQWTSDAGTWGGVVGDA